MVFQKFVIEYDKFSEIDTVVRFDVAVARSGGAEIVKFEIEGKNDAQILSRRLCALLKTLRNMKKNGFIQFFATEENFSSMSMEATFMYNKYSEYICVDKIAKENCTFVYVKL